MMYNAKGNVKEPDKLLRDSQGRAWFQTTVDGVLRCSYVGYVPEASCAQLAASKGLPFYRVGTDGHWRRDPGARNAPGA
jgi:hypothetical protein